MEGQLTRVSNVSTTHCAIIRERRAYVEYSLTSWSKGAILPEYWAGLLPQVPLVSMLVTWLYDPDPPAPV